MGTIACIDDRHWGHLAGILSGSLDEVAHGDNIGIVAHHEDGILERLTLGGAGCLGIREADDTSAKAIGCCLETQLSASGRLEEKVATTFPFNNSLLGCFSNSCAISRST